jgi:FkbM family methyltransferase
MSLRSTVRRGLEKLTGFKVYSRPPFGLDPIFDIKEKLSSFNFDVILDVGANTGQTAKKLAEALPSTRVFCIEPVKDTFEKLKSNLRTGNFSCHNLALGSVNGFSELVVGHHHTMNSLKQPEFGSAGNESKNLIVVKMLDTFCKDQSIDKISYLKIDTEGFDLEVLKGSRLMLSEKRIAFVEVEAGMNPENLYHVSLTDLKNYLESLDYYLFGIYEQVHEWMIKKPILRRVNAVFISKSLAHEYGKN